MTHEKNIALVIWVGIAILLVALIVIWFLPFDSTVKWPETSEKLPAVITPSVVGMDIKLAIATLESNNLRLGRVSMIVTNKFRAGTVISQNPRQSTRIDPGTPVHIVVQGEGAISPHVLIDNMMDNLYWGNIAFNHPTSMQIQEASVIELLVSLDRSVEDLVNEIIKIEIQMGSTQIQSGTIRVSNKMEARLTGSGFQIAALTPEVQALGAKESTAWKWEIKAISEGLQSLHLTIAVILSLNGKDTSKAIRTFDKKIDVKVSLGRKVSMFFKNNWQWLWAAILLPFAGWVWKSWHKPTGEKKPKD